MRKHENKFCQRGSIKIKEQRIRVPNKDGRFPCKNCNQTFKTKPIVKVHEKKSCKNRGSGVWSPLEPDCSFYPLLTEIYCFYGQRNLIFFGLLVVHKTREAIWNFLPMKPVGNFWAQNRIWTLGWTQSWCPAKKFEILLAGGLGPILFLNISISCQHGLFCFVNTLKNMLLLRNLTYFWGWNSEKSLNDLEYINTLILTYLLYWVANIFSYILHSNYRDTDFLIGVSLHAPCTFLHMIWITLIRSAPYLTKALAKQGAEHRIKVI